MVTSGSVVINDEGESGVSVELFTEQGWSVKVYLDAVSAWEMLNVLKEVLTSRWGDNDEESVDDTKKE